jgi:hypothetical protein
LGRTVTVLSHIRAVIETTMPEMLKTLEALSTDSEQTEMNKDQINAKLSRLPDKRNENLL